MASVRPLLGLLGVLLAVMAAEFNDVASSIALADIRGSLGIGYDTGTWIESLYVSGLACGMAFAPWLAVTFGLRRFTLFVIVLAAIVAALLPLASIGELFLALRAVQGFCAGLTIPLLMTTALLVLAPPVRLYGLAVYALTATFTAPFSTALAALYTDVFLDWRLIFVGSLPFSIIAFALVRYGMAKGEPRYDRFRSFDWRGAALIVLGFGAFTTLLLQGDRLDWFNSPEVSVLALVAGLCIPLLLVNEWYHPLPFLKLQLLLRPNFAFGVIVLYAFVVVGASSLTIPFGFLAEIQGYRPIQAYRVTLPVALGQLLMLPLLAMILDRRSIDARVVMLLGFSLVLTSCIACSRLDATWARDQFYLWQTLQMIGQPMIVMPLLMMATNTIGSPDEGPFASAIINEFRALAVPTGTWLVELVERWRGGFHSTVLVDRIGRDWYSHVRGLENVTRHPSPLLPDGAERDPGSLHRLAEAVGRQTSVLTAADTYLVMGAIVLALMTLTLVLPRRTYPPRIVFAKH